MADPSASVSPQLLHHLHALCVMKYPLYQSLQPELLVDMLLKTPAVVQQYTFAWSMIEPPPPGSLMLSWHPPAMGTSCASDGYVWADAENVHTVDVKGYVCLPVLLRIVCVSLCGGLSSRRVIIIISCASTLSRCMTLAVIISRLPVTIRDNITCPKSPAVCGVCPGPAGRKYDLSLRIYRYFCFLWLLCNRAQPH